MRETLQPPLPWLLHCMDHINLLILTVFKNGTAIALAQRT